MEATAVVDPRTVVELLDGLLGQDVSGSDDLSLADDLTVLQLARNLLDAEFLRRLAVFDARGGAATDHALSTQSWLRSQCRLSATAARGRVVVARRLREAGPLADVMVSGQISYEHAVVAAQALDKLPAAYRPEAEGVLMMAAVAGTPGDLRVAATRIREAVAPQTLVADEQAAADVRYLNVSRTLGGLVAVDGLFDPEAGEVLLAAGRVYATPDGPGDTRTAAQRRADGFVDVVKAGLDAATMPDTGGEKPHIGLLVDLGRHLAGAPPLPPDVLPGFLPGAGALGRPESGWTRVRPAPILIGQLPDGAVLAGETVNRLLCDASVHRVLTLGPSEVLDVGRRTRLWPPAIRRAAAVQYGGCGAVDCDRPPAFTDLHHVLHWLHGGPTSLDNGIPLCRRHHIAVHERGWHVIRHGNMWIAVPPGDPRAQPPPDDHAA
jgi:hypothetical protein